MLERYEQGSVTSDDWKRFRLARGIYGQRQPGSVQMIRVKIPQGLLLADQVDCLADIAARYSRGFGHVTTRQNVQFHFVKLEDCPKAMAELTRAGITTREACGNTIRNITACEFAGVCAGEPFDVTPYGEAITRYFLRREPFFDLSRKFKIALSGCPHDCAQGAIHDIGLLAQLRDGMPGFRVRVGGGLSTRPTEARVLEEFVPPDELLPACEAILWVFYRYGNRQNKSRARLKYVILTKGWNFFVAEYNKARAEIRARGDSKIPIVFRADESASALSAAKGVILAPPSHWLATNVRAQKQPGYNAVTIRLRRGDITALQMRGVAQMVRDFGDGTVRTQAHDQNLVLRWVANGQLGALYAELERLGLHEAGAGTIVDATSCPGGETCQLAYTTSRDLALDITRALEQPNGHAAQIAAARETKIKISGCPNSCGRHHVATLGWHGGVKRVGTGVVPVYQLHLGGGVDGNGARFGRQISKIPARRVSAAVLRLLDMYMAQRNNGETADAFFSRVPGDDVRQALDDLARIDETNVQAADYVDLGQSEAVKVEMGPGECAT